MIPQELFAALFELLGGPFTMTDVLRVAIIIPVFLYASYRDIKERRVRDMVWAPLLFAGVVLMTWDLVHGNTAYLAPVFAANLTFACVVGWVLFRYRLFYGADMKALIAIGLLIPAFPLLGQYPLYAPPSLDPPMHMTRLFALTVMSNTAAVSIIYPLSTLARNVKNGERNPRKLGWLLTARKVPIEKAGDGYGHIIETWKDDEPETAADGGEVEDAAEDATEDDRGLIGRVVARIPLVRRLSWFVRHGLYGPNTQFVRDYLEWRQDAKFVDPIDHLGEMDETHLEQFLDDQPEDGWKSTNVESDKEDLRQLAAQDEVWVTPGIPYLVPMTIGLIIALTFGDLVYAALVFLN